MDFCDGPVAKNLPCNAGDTGSILVLVPVLCNKKAMQ